MRITGLIVTLVIVIWMLLGCGIIYISDYIGRHIRYIKRCIK